MHGMEDCGSASGSPLSWFGDKGTLAQMWCLKFHISPSSAGHEKEKEEENQE